MHKYRMGAKIGEGTFSEVFKAQSVKTGQYVAIKAIKSHFDSLQKVNELREIQALRRLSSHPHIIRLVEILYDEPTGRLAMVFELMEQNLYEWIKDRKHYLPEEQVKLRIYQVLKALEHIHRHGIFHRDIKPENILLKDDQLRLADFGSCKGILSKQPYTEYISTRWYRAPECLLTDGYYDSKMDIWGLGCVFFEVLTLRPLFAGKNELDQVNKIHAIFGTPPQSLFDKFQKKNSHMDFNFPQLEGTGLGPLLPNVSVEARNVISRMLIYDAAERPSAKELLRDPYFHDLMEQDLVPRRRVSPTLELMPKIPSYQPAYEHQMFPSISKSNSYLKQFRQKQKNQERARLGVKLLPEDMYQTKKITLEPRKPYIPATLKLNFHKSLCATV